MSRHPFWKTALAAAVAVAVAGQAPLACAKPSRKPALSARSAVIIDAANGGILYSKNPHLRLPPASTTKVMTVLVALDKLPVFRSARVSRNAAASANSKAGLTTGADYRVWDLIIASLVASSNDAAVALAEAAAGSEDEFAKLMNAKAAKLGMRNTRFVNATGLPDKRKNHSQYSTAYDLNLLMREALKSRKLDEVMGITTATITGSDGRRISIKSHNKMLWRTPKFVKGKTGWTFASRHTFVGTNYEAKKRITFAMLSSTEPWTDIERLANYGLRLKSKTA